MSATDLHRTIETVLRIESAWVIAGLARDLVEDSLSPACAALIE